MSWWNKVHRGRRSFSLIALQWMKWSIMRDFLVFLLVVEGMLQWYRWSKLLDITSKCFVQRPAPTNTWIHFNNSSGSLLIYFLSGRCRWHHRLVSSHVGSFMLFKTLLTTFSRSFLALCSSSSDLFIFLLSCSHGTNDTNECFIELWTVLFTN